MQMRIVPWFMAVQHAVVGRTKNIFSQRYDWPEKLLKVLIKCANC